MSLVLTRATVEPWTGARVQARMSEAMRTLRMVGATAGPSQRVTSWPDVVHDAIEAYGWEKEGTVAPKASARDIRRMDEVQTWIARYLTRKACEAAGMVPDTGRIVTCRAMGWTYARVGRWRKVEWIAVHGTSSRLPGGNSRPSLVAIERKGLGYLATKLNLAGVPVDPDTMGGV